MTRSLPSFAQTTLWMAAHYRRTLFRGRKVLVLLALLVVGVLLALSVASLDGGRRAAGYEALMRQLTLGFLVQFVALFYGIAVVREEVENRTLTYLFVRPLPRSGILLGRWLAAALAVTAVVLGYALVAHVLTVPESLPAMGAGERLRRFLEGAGSSSAALAPPGLADVAVAASLSAVYYTSIFTAIAVLLPRPFLFGLGYIIFWEAALPMVPNAVATLSLKFHAINALGLAPANPLPFFEPPDVAPLTSVLVLGIATAVFLAVALYAFPRKEYITARAE